MHWKLVMPNAPVIWSTALWSSALGLLPYGASHYMVQCSFDISFPLHNPCENMFLKITKKNNEQYITLKMLQSLSELNKDSTLNKWLTKPMHLSQGNNQDQHTDYEGMIDVFFDTPPRQRPTPESSCVLWQDIVQ